MQAGDVIGGYRLESELGSGGMAIVWLALNTGLQRREAVKIPRLELLSGPEAQERFTDESRLSANFSHPNIVTIFAVGTHEHPHGMTVPYCAMELLTGGSLTALLRQRGRLSVKEAVPLLAQAAAALDYAHSQRVIHRDVKPGNMLFASTYTGFQDVLPPLLKVLDFGIAKALDAGDGRTMAGQVLGTPRFMSPEQAGSGAMLGPASDQYSLAIIAYLMLAGNTPFQMVAGASDLAILLQHINTPPPNPQELVSAIPDATAEAVLRGLAKAPEDRFASCTEMVLAIAAGAVSATARAFSAGVVFPKPDGCEDISGRIAAAHPGDTVYIPCGLYMPFTLNKALTLEFATGALISTEGMEPAVTVALPGAAAEAVIRGLTVRAAFPTPPEGETGHGTAVNVVCGTVSLEHCDIAAQNGNAVLCGDFHPAEDRASFLLSGAFSGRLTLRHCRLAAPGHIGVAHFALLGDEDRTQLRLENVTLEDIRYGIVIPCEGELFVTGSLLRRCTGVGILLGTSPADFRGSDLRDAPCPVWDRYGSSATSLSEMGLNDICSGPEPPAVEQDDEWWQRIFAHILSPGPLSDNFLASLPPESILFFRAGRYSGALTVRQPVTLVGDTGAEVCAERRAVADVALAKASAGSSVTLFGLRLFSVGPSENQGIGAVSLRGGSLLLRQCAVSADAMSALVALSGILDAKECQFGSSGSSGVRFTRSLTDILSSVNLSGALKNCQVVDCRESGVAVHGASVHVSLVECEIARCDTGLAAGVMMPVDVLFQKGVIQNCRTAVSAGRGVVRLNQVRLQDNATDTIGKVVFEDGTGSR